MSVENLKEYARRCAAEPELRDTARTLGVGDVEGHMHHAEDLGLDWTRADLAAFRKEVIDAEGDLEDLGEEELEQIAGGAATLTAIVAVSVGVGIAAGGVVGIAVGGAVGSGAAGGAAAAGEGGW